MRPVALVVCLLLGSSTAADEAAVVLEGGRIVTVGGPTIEKGSLVMERGKIVAVGEAVEMPDGATIVDVTGETVYPGLIDGLTTLGLTEIGSVKASDDTSEVGEINPHARAWIALQPHSELIPVARAGGLTTVLTAPDGGLISGQSALLRLAGSTPDALTILAPVAMHLSYPTGRPPFDMARLFQEPELKTFEARQKERKQNQEKDLKRLGNLLEEAKAYGAALEAAASGKARLPAPDLSLEALAPAARGELPVVVRADREDDIRGAVLFAHAHGLRLILSGGLDAWRCVDLLKEHDVPVLLNVDRLPRKESDPYDAPYTNALRLHEAGVRFALVSDSAANARNLPYEAAMARSFGLPAAAAIRAITLSPAEIFGVSDRLGTLAPGKDANVVVATGDIMDHRTQVTRVFIDGVAQALETKHTRLYEAFKARP